MQGRDAPGGRCPAPYLLPRLATRPSGGWLPTARLRQGTSDCLPCRQRAPVPPSLSSPCPPPCRGAAGRAGSHVSSPGKPGADGAFALLSLAFKTLSLCRQSILLRGLGWDFLRNKQFLPPRGERKALETLPSPLVFPPAPQGSARRRRAGPCLLLPLRNGGPGGRLVARLPAPAAAA